MWITQCFVSFIKNEGYNVNLIDYIEEGRTIY